LHFPASDLSLPFLPKPKIKKLKKLLLVRYCFGIGKGEEKEGVGELIQ